jgi:hypothetical protein
LYKRFIAFFILFTDFIAVTMPPRKRTAMSFVKDLIDAVYPAVFQNYHNLNWLRERVILAAKNENVHKIMNQILAMLAGVVTEYKSIDTVVDADEVVNFPLEFLNSLDYCHRGSLLSTAEWI